MVLIDDTDEGFPAVPKGLLDICSKWLSRRAAIMVNEDGALEPAVVLIYLCHHPLGPKTRPIATNGSTSLAAPPLCLYVSLATLTGSQRHAVQSYAAAIPVARVCICKVADPACALIHSRRG